MLFRSVSQSRYGGQLVDLGFFVTGAEVAVHLCSLVSRLAWLIIIFLGAWVEFEVYCRKVSALLVISCGW